MMNNIIFFLRKGRWKDVDLVERWPELVVYGGEEKEMIKKWWFSSKRE
jgi:hypothetical protein